MSVLIFYGNHSEDWMSVLNENLTKYFKMSNVIKIKNTFDIKTLNTEITMCNDNRVTVIPLMENHIVELHQCYKKIKNVNILMPSLTATSIYSNKIAFSKFVKKYNLTQYTPTTYDSYESTKKNDTEKIYITKHKNSANGCNTYIKKELTENDFKDNIVQEYICNEHEYVAHIIAKNGKIIECIIFVYYFDNKLHIKQHPLNTENISKIKIEQNILIF